MQFAPPHTALLSGSYHSTHAFGWTELEIDAASQVLSVTVYGVLLYTAQTS